MIKEFVSAWEANKQKVFDEFMLNRPYNYIDVVRATIKSITSDDIYGDFNPDPERIHQIDDGDYQGTLIFVIAEKGYQPNEYWYVKVSYGSCSGCDTLQAIKDSYNSEDSVTEAEAKQYQTLALHIVQGLKLMGEETV